MTDYQDRIAPLNLFPENGKSDLDLTEYDTGPHLFIFSRQYGEGAGVDLTTSELIQIRDWIDAWLDQ